MTSLFNDVGQLNFYGFDQKHLCDFSFLSSEDPICAYVSSVNDLSQISKDVPEPFVDYYSDNPSLGLKPLAQFDANKCNLLAVVRHCQRKTHFDGDRLNP
jgi:hypothetical protein